MFKSIFTDEFYPDYYNDVYSETLDQMYNVDINYRYHLETGNVDDNVYSTDHDLNEEYGVDFSPKSCELETTNKTKRLGSKATNPGIVNFVVDLLHNPNTNPSIIKWEDHEKGKFRFIKPERVSKLWGMRNAKIKEKEMDFGKFSRAIRYHYGQGNFIPVPEQKLVYKFGPNAKGWKNNVL